MSKKYDNNLNEIKNTIPIKTFSTNSMEIKEDEENNIYEMTTTFLTQFYDAKEQYMIDSLLKDMQENKDRYKGLTIIPIQREQVVELLNKGKEYEQLKQQLEEKDKEIERLSALIPPRHDGKTLTRLQILNEWEKELRHQICEKIREIAVKEINKYKDANITYTIREEDLDQIEKGE